MVMYRQRSEEQHNDLLISYQYFENVAQFTYLGTVVTNQNSAV